MIEEVLSMPEYPAFKAEFKRLMYLAESLGNMATKADEFNIKNSLIKLFVQYPHDGIRVVVNSNLSGGKVVICFSPGTELSSRFIKQLQKDLRETLE
jgi:hypothetical protein